MISFIFALLRMTDLAVVVVFASWDAEEVSIGFPFMSFFFDFHSFSTGLLVAQNGEKISHPGSQSMLWPI